MNVDLQKPDAARAWDAVEEMFPVSPARPNDSMTLIERESVSNYRYNFLADRAKIILKHFTVEGATERINELVIALNAVHADYLEARKRRDALEAELVEARTAFLTSSAIQAAAVEEAHKACDAWAEQDQESARKALVLMAERDAALNRLGAMCEHRWQCYGLKRDDGATFWYVRDRNNRITDGCATPEQAIDSAINRAQELNRKLAAGKTPSDQDLGFRFSARDFGV